MVKGLMEEQIEICTEYLHIINKYKLELDTFSLYNTIEKTHGSCKPFLFTHEYSERMWDRHGKVVQCMDDVISSMVVEYNLATKQYNDFLKFHKNLEEL